MSFEWFVASRYLRAKRRQSFISIISLISVGGVAIGIATVILVISVMHGFEQSLKEKFLANEAHITIQSPRGFFEDYNEVIQQILQIENIVSASPAIYSQLAIQSRRSKRIEGTIYVKGIDPKFENDVTGFSEFVDVDGEIDFENSELLAEAREISAGPETIRGGIILGANVASRIGVVKGDILRLISKMEPNPANPTTFFADVSNFAVIGIYESGMYAYDNAFGFVSISSAQKIYDRENKINMIQVRVAHAENASQIADRIRSKVRFSGDGLGAIPITRTWVDSHAPLFDAIKLEKIATVIIEALIILVASFNIASTLIMMVMEKIRDVGTLRAIGASKQAVSRIFTMQGVIIGILGSIIGSTLGIALCLLLDLEVIRPSRWFALLIIIPIALQLLIALRSSIRLLPSMKFGMTLIWIGIVGFVLYCVVQPIRISGEVYQLNRLAVEIDWFFVIFINILSFTICWLATLYPAWQASKMNPIEALRHE